MPKSLAPFIALVALQAIVIVADSHADDVSFSRDVLPILSDRCFHCHGPDESHRQAELRLDLRDEAIATRNGSTAIVPNHASKSDLMTRILSSDPDDQMPPPNSHRKPLSPREKETLKKWIDQGAVWGKHWAFETPTRPIPKRSDLHPIDVWIQHRLQAERLSPSPPADKRTLLRRLSFDLIGLPPSHHDVMQFQSDAASDSYSKQVDRLLASKHFGERMAMWWLDVARYSDTDGFQQDATRTNWPWRDWVVQAFNRNLPFNQFTIDQFAGDLLPDATDDQKLATCFHRNHMTNGEGGRDPEESRIDYVIDRVNTMGTAFMGLTLGCCQCHSHKFDPISQHEYYSLFAFFNNIDEDGKAGSAAKPYLKYESPFLRQSLDDAQALVDDRTPIAQAAKQLAEAEFEIWLNEKFRNTDAGFQAWRPLLARELSTAEGTSLERSLDGIVQAGGKNPLQDDYRFIASSSLPRITGLRLEVFPHKSHTEGKLSRGRNGEFILTDIKLQVRKRGYSQIRDIDIVSAVADVERTAKAREYGLIKDTLDDDPRNGWTTESHDSRSVHTAIFELADPLVLAKDEELQILMLHRSTEGDANIGRFRWSATDQRGACLRSLDPLPLELLAAHVRARSVPDFSTIDSSLRSIDENLRAKLLDQFLSDHDPYQRAHKHLERAKKQREEIKRIGKTVNVMVLAESEKGRSNHVLERGVWDKKGDVIQPSFPRALLTDVDIPSRSRLDLAHWLVSPNHPLTSRVVANHLWQLCFGQGLVRTPDDFGLQGELPSHPEVLDWLAVELIESDWDIKHLLKTIVSTQAYQQSSRATAEQRQLDPENKLLSRGSRYRLPSWMLRDAALQASGLLYPQVGGPPVMPYQPESVWAEITMGRFGYQSSQGLAQYRRTLYAFWRRSSAPTFLFDSAQRRTCEVRSLQTNTPLHALTLLNDPTILECSKAIAIKATENQNDVDSQTAFSVRSVLNRDPTEQEQIALRLQCNQALDFYRDHPSDLASFLDFGQPELNASILAEKRSQVAAITILASSLFNLDEAMTHE